MFLILQLLCALLCAFFGEVEEFLLDLPHVCLAVESHSARAAVFRHDDAFLAVQLAILVAFDDDPPPDERRRIIAIAAARPFPSLVLVRLAHL